MTCVTSRFGTVPVYRCTISRFEARDFYTLKNFYLKVKAPRLES